MTEPVRVVALIRTQPGKGPEQVAAFEALAPIVRAEEGCLFYDLHTVEEDPDRFVFLERWASREALTTHATSAHMWTAGEVSATFRAGPAEVLVLSDDSTT